VEVRHVVEHPRGDDEVERPVGERQVLDVGDARVDSAVAREPYHPRREIDCDDLRPGLARDPLRQLAPTAADLEDAARRRSNHCVDERYARILAGAGARVAGGAAAKT